MGFELMGTLRGTGEVVAERCPLLTRRRPFRQSGGVARHALVAAIEAPMPGLASRVAFCYPWIERCQFFERVQ
jgi:hypothetical protein